MIIVPADSDGTRLDVFLLPAVPPGITRGAVQRAIRQQKIRVDEKQMVKPGAILHAGQTIRIHPDAFAASAPPEVTADPTIPVHILWEDPDLLVVEKPAGLPVHAGLRHVHPTLADALVARYSDIRNVGEDPLRPGIVHRLDKDTSGVLLVARTPEMFQHLKRQFKERRVKKEYVALVRGVLREDEGVVKLPLTRSKRNPLRRAIARDGSGKTAETGFRVRTRYAHHTLLDIFPVTGRMHQIRVHLAHLGFPVVGDVLYGKREKDASLPKGTRQLLHAASITITLPSGKNQTFESPFPADFQSVLDGLQAAAHTGNPHRHVRFRMRFPRPPHATY